MTPVDDARICRICLENSDGVDMIAPCLCRGSSKWVHRSCLDKWRLTESYLPFHSSKRFLTCGTCKFNYLFEDCGQGPLTPPTWKINMLVVRDVLLAFAFLQLTILAVYLYLVLYDGGMPYLAKVLLPESWPLWLSRYLTGFFLVTALIGFLTIVGMLSRVCRGGVACAGCQSPICDCCGGCSNCDGGSDGGVLFIALVVFFIIGIIAIVSFLFFVFADFARKRKQMGLNIYLSKAQRVRDLSMAEEDGRSDPASTAGQGQPAVNAAMD